MNPNLTKSCTNCDEVLELEDFPRDRSKGGGHKSICKECDRGKARDHYKANREKGSRACVGALRGEAQGRAGVPAASALEAAEVVER